MNNTALAIIQPGELEVIQRTARLLAVSNYFDGKGDNALAIAMIATKILAGREMGFGPFASANGIHIISGKPAVGANLMASAVRSSSRYDYRVREMTNDKCAIEFFEREGDKKVSIGVSEFTKEDAVKAGTQNMTKFPRNMLFARAMSNGVRWYCPDVFSGNAVYVPEELGAEVDSDGNVIESMYHIAPQATQTPATPSNGETGQNGTSRKVDASTGEITDTNGDVLFDTSVPDYAREWQALTGKEYDLVKWVSTLHRKSTEPCTLPQYQFLTGIMDKLTSKNHRYALSLLCQSVITKDNLPGRKVADNLLDLLTETIKEEGEEDKPNPNYRDDMADLITAIATVSTQQQELVAAP